MEKAHLIRQIRGRKRMQTPEGRTYNLEEIFDDLNVRFFYRAVGSPTNELEPG